jgi:hypothetical protein
MRKTAKMTRRRLVGMAAVTAAAITMAAMPATASAEEAVGSTPASYEAYLVEQVELGDTDAQQTLDEFQALSEGEQEQFITYLNDPERGQELGDFLSDVTDVDSINEESYETELTKTSENGDVVLEATTGIDQVESVPSTDEELADPTARYYDWNAWYQVSDKILGVTVTTVKIGVNYRTTKSRVVKVYSGYASHRNRVPFVEFRHGIVSKWISADPANNATAETIWQGEWKGIAWDGRQRVWADQSGFKGGYLK